MPNQRAATPTELWYLECFRQLAAYLGVAPTMNQLARHCGRAVFPAWSAMKSLEAKGYVRRVGEDRVRTRFEIVARDPK